jgi:hypothetical protein
VFAVRRANFVNLLRSNPGDLGGVIRLVSSLVSILGRRPSRLLLEMPYLVHLLSSSEIMHINSWASLDFGSNYDLEFCSISVHRFIGKMAAR